MTTGLGLGGAELLLADLVTRSDATRFSHSVVSLLPDGAVRRRIDDAGIPVRDLGMRHGRASLKGLRDLRRIVHEGVGARHARIVHAWMYHACLGATLAVAGRSRHRFRLLWGLHAANLDLTRFHKTTTFVTTACRFLSRAPDAIAVNSRTTHEYHANQGYHAKRWVPIPNGIDIDSFRPDAQSRLAIRTSLGIGENEPLIGFIARRDPQKDHATFLRAAAILTARMPSAHFLLAGSGTGPEDGPMKELVQRYAPRVSLHQLGAREDIASVTAALDIATMCSFGESFSNAVVEAMACGVPCVVSDVPPLPQLVGSSGIAVGNGDPDALATAWQSLVEEEPHRRRARTEAGRRRVAMDYSVAQMIHRFEALYQELAGA